MIDINLHRIAINQHLWIWVFIICTYTSTGIEIYHICILYLYIVCMHVCISCTSLTKGPHRLVALPNHHLECHPSKIVSICPTLFCMYIRKYTVYAAYKQSRTCVCIVIYYIIYQYWYFFDISVNINIWILIYCIYICISGWWFQPLWKIWKSDWIIIPTIGENKQCSKPPTRYVLDIFLNILQGHRKTHSVPEHLWQPSIPGVHVGPPGLVEPGKLEAFCRVMPWGSMGN